MSRWRAPVYCDRDPDCAVQILLAILAPTPAGGTPRWAAFEARDRAPFTPEAAGCRVIVADRQAWRPADLVEDYMVRHEITEAAAKEIVSGFPFHRLHVHESADPAPGGTTEKEHAHP